ncbi:MAG: hypothetical protein KF861_22740, partial [Planctomycetaceae bacterium]|nr:hypothetical protein [Planctomycetaceae bacterium]
FDTVNVEWNRWTSEPQDGEIRRTELHPDAHSGKYAFRLLSESVSKGTADLSSMPEVWIASPPISVQAGQVVIASGHVRVERAITNHPDGLMIYDNVKGTVGALRWQSSMPKGKWQPFRILREVAASRDYQLIIELNGDGDVRIDDLMVTALSPVQVQTAGGFDADPGRPRRNLLELPSSLPKVLSWPGRKSDSPPP